MVREQLPHLQPSEVNGEDGGEEEELQESIAQQSHQAYDTELLEGGRERGREGGRERGREGEREGGRKGER